MPRDAASLLDHVGGRNAPPMAGKFRGPVLVAASARCLWDDLEALPLADWPGDVICVNFTGLFFPVHFQHWVSLHGSFLSPWLTIRKALVPGPHIWTHGPASDPGEIAWDFERGGGTSSMFACQVAVALGYQKIVLAGVPLDDSGHFYDPPQGKFGFSGFGFLRSNYATRTQQIEWTSFHAGFGELIRSMSGRTRSIFGAPTREWLEG